MLRISGSVVENNWNFPNVYCREQFMFPFSMHGSQCVDLWFLRSHLFRRNSFFLSLFFPAIPQIGSLIIESTRKKDSGNYSCSPSNSPPITVSLHVINGKSKLGTMANCRSTWHRRRCSTPHKCRFFTPSIFLSIEPEFRIENWRRMLLVVAQVLSSTIIWQHISDEVNEFFFSKSNRT